MWSKFIVVSNDVYMHIHMMPTIVHITLVLKGKIVVGLLQYRIDGEN